MAKRKTTAVKAAPDAMVQPVPVVPVATMPYPRVRGSGPVCPRCGSGMIQNGTDRTNHPLLVRVYWKCKNPECKGTDRTEERK